MPVGWDFVGWGFQISLLISHFPFFQVVSWLGLFSQNIAGKLAKNQFVIL